MVLGVSYIVFHGEELLEYAIKAIRPAVDFISVVYQTTSFYGQKAHPETTLEKIKEIDCLHHFDTDLNVKPKENELKTRNVGLELSIKAGCTHHISADCDEFYKLDELIYAKETMTGDCSIIGLENYFKQPTWKIVPNQKQLVTFIQPVTTKYAMVENFPFYMDKTRRCIPHQNYKLFDNMMVHNMSYVRKDIKSKLNNSGNGNFYNKEKFLSDFDKYQVGEALKIAPDFVNRKTVLVDNYFNIKV